MSLIIQTAENKASSVIKPEEKSTPSLEHKTQNAKEIALQSVQETKGVAQVNISSIDIGDETVERAFQKSLPGLWTNFTR